MVARRLVLDANILIRAVLGRRVKKIIDTYATQASFFVPAIAYDDAERHLPQILTKHDRADEVQPALAFLTQLQTIVTPMHSNAASSPRCDARS